MITDIASYLRFFDSVRRRTERDVAALPPAAAEWCMERSRLARYEEDARVGAGQVGRLRRESLVELRGSL
jgi:hypothetical protein